MGEGTPFDWAIALDYYDGLVDGFIRCSGCGREYRLRMIGARIEALDSAEEREIRDFELSPIPEGSMTRFSEAMTPYHEPAHPNWVPIWRFPTDREKGLMDRLVDQIYGQAGPVELVVSSSTWPTEEALNVISADPGRGSPEAAVRSVIQ